MPRRIDHEAAFLIPDLAVREVLGGARVPCVRGDLRLVMVMAERDVIETVGQDRAVESRAPRRSQAAYPLSQSLSPWVTSTLFLPGAARPHRMPCGNPPRGACWGSNGRPYPRSPPART